MQDAETKQGAHGGTTAMIAFGVFFFSGMAGLIYQVVWSRMLTLVLGVSIYAITAVICTFMAGLALGSYFIGRMGDRWRQPIRAYGVIEAVIGVYAGLTPWIFESIQPLYVEGFRALDGGALNAFRVGVSAAVLLVPTLLMGGTLPLLSNAVATSGAGAARAVGRLYAVNTFGAVAGCLAAGFVLLASYGIRTSIFIAAAMNLAIAAVCFVVPRASAPATAAGPVASEAGSNVPRDRFVLALFFLSGFAALGYEVLWSRALLVYLRSSTYAFSLMLSVYLVGIALGSAGVAGLAARSRRPLLGLALCQLGVVGSVFAGLLVFPNLESIGFAVLGTNRVESFGSAVSLMFVQAGVVLLLPTIFMGAMFPLGIAAYDRPQRGLSRSVGSLYAVNTFGNILGSLTVGFGTIGWIGVRNSMLLMLFFNLLVATLITVRQGRIRPLRWAAPVAAASVLLAIHLAISPHLFLQTHHRLPGSSVVYYREGPSDTVAVVERQFPRRSRTLVYGDGRGAAGTDSLVWNLYFGHLPMLLHRDPQQVLHICYGSGNSVMALTRHDPQRIDVVELSPHVREASRYFWTNEGVIDDPRVELVIEDGRNFLLGSDRRWDVISLEPPNIFSAGVVNLYTQEFYELARERLLPGGIMVQWLPTATLSTKDRGHLMRAFAEAFPHVYVFQQLQSPVLLLVGTVEPLEVDVDEVERRLRSVALAKDARTMGTPDAARFLSWFKLGDQSFRRLAEPYEPVRDDRTIVDYSIPHYIGSGFGFYLNTYPLGPEGYDHQTEVRAKIAEYASWRDPISLIVPDPGQAKRVGRVSAREGRAASGP